LDPRLVGSWLCGWKGHLQYEFPYVTFPLLCEEKRGKKKNRVQVEKYGEDK
jgi:hypothetical protein